MHTPMNVFVFLYDNFADFEIVQALLVLGKTKNSFVSFEKNEIRSYNQFRVLPDITLDEMKMNLDDVDIFLIPGGEPKEIIRNPLMHKKVQKLKEILHELKNNNKIIAAICGGPVFLANSGILDGLHCTASIQDDELPYFQDAHMLDKDYVVEGNILTAKGQAFTEFAIELAKLCNIFQNAQEITETIHWLRNEKYS